MGSAFLQWYYRNMFLKISLIRIYDRDKLDTRYSIKFNVKNVVVITIHVRDVRRGFDWL